MNLQPGPRARRRGTPAVKRSLLSCCLLALLTANPAPAADMANTLVYAGENEDTINPVLSPHQELPTIIFSGLMKFDAKGLPVPDLAKSVDYDPKTLTYTFHLRDGVKWHDDTPFSARDVVYTYTALTSDKTLTSTITSNYQDISQISAPDEHTVVIRLARVNAAMLDNFCMGILPAHIYEGHDINTVPANHAPVGTGRFKFVSWDTAGGMIVLERNSDYYGKVPSIERIVYKTVAVESTKALMLRSGEADLAWLNAKYARTFRGKDGFTTVDFTTADLRTVAMDFHTPFWQRNMEQVCFYYMKQTFRKNAKSLFFAAEACGFLIRAGFDDVWAVSQPGLFHSLLLQGWEKGKIIFHKNAVILPGAFGFHSFD